MINPQNTNLGFDTQTPPITRPEEKKGVSFAAQALNTVDHILPEEGVNQFAEN